MFKKIVSVLLTLSLLFSFGAVTASAKEIPNADEIVGALMEDAAGITKSVSLLKSLSESLLKNLQPYIMNVVLTPENIDTAVDAGSKVMAKLIDKIMNPSQPEEPTEPSEPSEPTDPSEPTAPVDPTDPTDPSEPSKGSMLIEELKVILQRYIFVKVDDVDAASMKAIESADISYELVTDTDGTVYISVDIENNPDIFNFAVFRNVVDGLYAAQGEELIKNNNGETDYAMSYEHIAGELALHAVVFAVTNEIINVTGTKNEIIVKLYEKAAVVALNYDEARVPSEMISMIGVLLVDFLQFNLLKLFGVL